MVARSGTCSATTYWTKINFARKESTVAKSKGIEINKLTFFVLAKFVTGK